MQTPRFIINEDNDHYFKLGPERMNEPSLREYIRQYAAVGVSAISFCNAGQRCSYPSRVIDPIWAPLPDGSLTAEPWPHRLHALFQAGLDPYAIWLDECRKCGIEAWISTRMNDVHQTQPSMAFRADRRWFLHPEWTRVPSRFDLRPGQSWDYYQSLQPDLAWNYAHPDVRELMGALLEETAGRYDADVHELDFSRDFYCLTPGRAREESPILTALLRTHRQLLDGLSRRRGRPMRLAVRVPWTPDIAVSWGFDVRQWAAEGLVDIFVASPYWRSFQYDFDLAAWRSAVGTAVEVIPAVDQWICAGPELPILSQTAEFLRGWCGVMALRQAEAVYVFNYPYFLQDEYLGPAEAEKFRSLHRCGVGRILEEGARCSQIGYLDFPAEGEDCHSDFPLRVEGEAIVRLPFGEVPSGGFATVTPVADTGTAPSCLLNGCEPDANGRFPASALRVGDNEITLRGTGCSLANLYLTWHPGECSSSLYCSQGV